MPRPRRIAGAYRIARGARDAGAAGLERPVHRLAVPLCRRRGAAARGRDGTRTQLRRTRILGQPQPGLPVAGHRRLPAAPSPSALPVRRGIDQRRADAWRRASSWSPTTSITTAATTRWRCRTGRSRISPHRRRSANSMRDDRLRRAQGQPQRAWRFGADALQAVHRSVRAGRRALPRVRRRSGLQRFDRRPDRGRSAAHPPEEAPALPAARRHMPFEGRPVESMPVEGRPA